MSINDQLYQILKDISTSLNQELLLPENCSTQDIIDALKLIIELLLEQVQLTNNSDYDELEKAVQKAEAEIRSHVRLEQQMKLFSDSLQEKIDQLEAEKLLLQQQYLEEKKSHTHSINFQTKKDDEKKSTNTTTQQRESSPNIIKKSYIMGNQIYHRQHQSNLITYQDQNIPKNTSQEPINRERRSANTQHVSYIPGKGLPVKNVTNSNVSYHNPQSNRREERNKSQQSQERIADKSQQLLKSQNSYSYIKMYNIQKLIINKNQSEGKTLTQLAKSKTIHGVCNNNVLDDSNYKKK